jgi:hypothetical protein
MNLHPPMFNRTASLVLQRSSVITTTFYGITKPNSLRGDLISVD